MYEPDCRRKLFWHDALTVSLTITVDASVRDAAAVASQAHSHSLMTWSFLTQKDEADCEKS